MLKRQSFTNVAASWNLYEISGDFCKMLTSGFEDKESVEISVNLNSKSENIKDLFQTCFVHYSKSPEKYFWNQNILWILLFDTQSR